MGVKFWNNVRALGKSAREFTKQSQAILPARNHQHQRIVDFKLTLVH
jgi:hypothetical protein